MFAELCIELFTCNPINYGRWKVCESFNLLIRLGRQEFDDLTVKDEGLNPVLSVIKSK